MSNTIKFVCFSKTPCVNNFCNEIFLYKIFINGNTKENKEKQYFEYGLCAHMSATSFIYTKCTIQ